MIRFPVLPVLFLAGFTAAVAESKPSAAPAQKVGWVETVKLDLQGWTVHADTSLVDGQHKELGKRALSMLDNHLERIAILMPEKQLKELRGLEIFVENHHPELGSMQYHPGVDWLNERGYDPRLFRKVHIPRAAELVSRGQMLKHPAVILHELAHAYHDQILGFEEADIVKAYNDAMGKGIYQKSLLFNGETVKHYATTDHKEYFAEATESYFYHNDFYPFVRAELRRHDPAAFAIMERVWGKAD
jgi:dipeptidyl-peptidase-4